MATISEAIALAGKNYQDGRPQEAEDICRRVIEVDPENAEAWHLLGLATVQLKRNQEGIDAVARAVSISPDSATYYNSLGACYSRLGQLAKAEACFRQAVSLDPSRATAVENLIQVLQRAIYPMWIPPMRVQRGLDFLLLNLPPFDGAIPHGIAFVHNALERARVRLQTIDANILLCHCHFQRRGLGGVSLMGGDGQAIPDNLWGGNDHLGWERKDVLDYFWPKLRDLLQQIAAERPKAVGLSVHANNRPIARRFVAELRELAPEVLVVVGGYDCANVESAPLLFPDFDYMVIREADLTVGPLVQAITRGERPRDLPGVLSRWDTPGRVWDSGPLLEDLDSVEFPRYQWTNPELYRAVFRHPSNNIPISASRGCNWGRCRFCEECFPFRLRSPVRVVDEIEQWVHQGGCSFYFFESNVNGDPDVLDELCREVIRRRLNVNLCAQARVDKRNSLDHFRHLRAAGFHHLRFGVDGWTDHTLKLQAKGYTMATVFQNLRDCKMAGLNVGANLVVGIPGETEEDVEETIENIVRCKDLPVAIEYVNPLSLRVACEYFRNAEKYKICFPAGKEAAGHRGDYVPEDLWYSEEPFIDQALRTERLLRICREIRRRGVPLGPAATQLVARLEQPGAYVDGSGEVRVRA